MSSLQLANRWRRVVSGCWLGATLLAGGAAASPVLEAATAIVPATWPEPTETLVYVVRSGDTLARIASRLRAQTGHFGLDETLNTIRAANGLEGSLLRPGQRLLVPRASPHQHPAVAAPTRDGADLRGIYLTGPVCGYASVFERVDAFVAVGGNGVVFDVKDIDGGVSFRSRQPLAAWGRGRSAPFITDVAELLRRFHAQGLGVVARLALFLDGELGKQRPGLALYDEEGNPWTERGAFWMNPELPEVQAYNIGLAVEIARAGADEVQLDYVRFPTNGWRGDWLGDLEATADRRCTVITEFLATLADSLRPYGTRLSADLYGIMAWGRVEDLAVTGQDVSAIAEHVDFICPMIYPSHFGPGFAGIENPADAPGILVAEGVQRFAALAAGRAAVRPWLQAFPWRVSDYDGAYVSAQVAAAESAGGAGWCLWNPASRYDTACAGLLAVTPADSAAADPELASVTVPGSSVWTRLPSASPLP